MRWTLRTRILLSVGVVIFFIQGVNTFLNVRFLQRDYFKSVEWRSAALASDIEYEIHEIYEFSAYIPSLLDGVSGRCEQLYEANKQKDITHIAVINQEEHIVAHSDKRLKNSRIESTAMLAALKQQEQTTLLENDIYHLLLPVFGTQENIYLATVDVGFPKTSVDGKIRQLLLRSAMMFLVFTLLSFVFISLLLHVVVTKPVRRLAQIGKLLATGDLGQTFSVGRGNDEISIMEQAFHEISVYLQHVADVASHISLGVLDKNVKIRSSADILGKAIQEMLHYLRIVEDVAAHVAEGNLTGNIEVRSANDRLGQAILAMTDGLRRLIVQIRTSAEELARTERSISSLSADDVAIVNNVHQSADAMIATMHQMGGSVEEVAINMNALSDSMELTATSVSEMSSAIAYIAKNNDNLTEKTAQTISRLEHTLMVLDEIVKHTDQSKELSQETMITSREGQEAMGEVMQSMETIQQTIEAAVNSITRFAQRSQDIGTILEVIRNITEQTSLLALNASIIAAQAGSHGRGFAIVADEIRNLAHGVSASTKDIASIVQSLQQDTKQVVQTILDGEKNAKQGMERTWQAHNALTRILDSAQRSSSVVSNIAEMLHQLKNSTQNVSGAMDQVNLMTNDITAATNEQKASTDQIHLAVQNIQNRVEQIHKATEEQLNGVQRVLEAMDTVMGLIDHNLASSQQIHGAAEQLSLQSALLVRSVDQFELHHTNAIQR